MLSMLSIFRVLEKYSHVGEFIIVFLKCLKCLTCLTLAAKAGMGYALEKKCNFFYKKERKWPVTLLTLSPNMAW